MTITIRPRWSLGRGKTLVPSRWQATITSRSVGMSASAAALGAAAPDHPDTAIMANGALTRAAKAAKHSVTFMWSPRRVGA